MRSPLPLHIGASVLRPDLDERTVFLNIPDVQGSYTIPYIQASPHLEIFADSSDPAVGCASLCLSGGGMNLKSSLLPGKTSATFRGLPPGEYSLSAAACDCSDASGLELHYERIGVGTVLAAIGDSITEGYFGHEFDWTGDLLAGGFPPAAVSRDGRNYPQFGPTTLHHRGGWKCMQSWMTDLNDMLAAALGRPVFVANEGWGGYRTCDYLKLMKEDSNWQQRMVLLKPTVWLIHLGVNDERAVRSAKEFGKDLEAIIDLLCHRYQAAAEAIFLARPCYDYAGGAAAILASYCGVIDEIIARRGLSRGPDFFGAYSRDRQRFYGADPVHPNVEGMKHMAALWAEEILCQPRRWDPVQMRGSS